MKDSMVNRIFSNEQRKDEKIRRTERQKDEEFVQGRDKFQALMTDESTPVGHNHDSADLTKWQQDFTEEIDHLMHQLRREVQDEKGKWHRQTIIIGYDKKGEPVYDYLPAIMNELGIRMLVDLARPQVSRNLMMSNYNEDRILMKLKRAVSTLIIHLGYNHEKYGILKTDLDAIIQLFRDTIEPSHFRSLNNGERNFLNTVTKRLESHSLSPAALEKKKGWGFFG